MNAPRRSFLGCVFGGLAATTLKASGLTGTTEVEKTLILPSQVAEQLGDDKSLIITSMDDPRASRVSRYLLGDNLGEANVWFGMPYEHLVKMQESEYSAWLAAHVRINHDFGYQASAEYRALDRPMF